MMLTNMEENKETPPPIIEQLQQYAETRIKLAKYQAVEGGSSILASITADIAVIICSSLAFIFASITLGFYLGSVLGADWEGFGCVAIIYLLIAVFVKVYKKNIEKPLVNAFIHKIFK